MTLNSLCTGLLLLLWLAPAPVTVRALSSSGSGGTEMVPRKFIRIVNPIDTSSQEQLPASFVETWPTWILDNEGGFTKIPDTDGFVPPASIDELWQPVDLKYPELRLALGIHVRNGQIRHIMPAVDATLGGDGKHRNRGKCSVPRAHSWINYLVGMERWKLRLSARNTKKKEEPWTPLLASGSIKATLARVVQALYESPPDALGTGSHILHVPLPPDETDLVAECPRAGHELRVTLGGEKDEDAEAAPGVLQVVVAAARAGSDSEYLPEAYEPLFTDAELRSPIYEKFKKRQSANKQKMLDELEKQKNEL